MWDEAGGVRMALRKVGGVWSEVLLDEGGNTLWSVPADAETGADTPEAKGTTAGAPSPVQTGKALRLMGKDDAKHRLLLEDGSWWEVNPDHRVQLIGSMAGESVTVLKGTSAERPYRFVEGLFGTVVEARQATN